MYENALAYDLRQAGFQVKQQVDMLFLYKGIQQDIGYRLDILVENKVIIEIKSIEKLAPVHYAQTLTYLKLSGLKLGLLINFNTTLKKTTSTVSSTTYNPSWTPREKNFATFA